MAERYLYAFADMGECHSWKLSMWPKFMSGYMAGLNLANTRFAKVIERISYLK